MQISEIMTRDPACCTRDTSLQEVAHMMVDCDCGAVPVVDSQSSRKPAGIITDRDIVTRSMAEGKNPMQMRTEDVMTSPALYMSPENTVQECVRFMEDNQVRRILVVDDNESVVGIVAQADLAQEHVLAGHAEEFLEELSQPSMEASQPSS